MIRKLMGSLFVLSAALLLTSCSTSETEQLAETTSNTATTATATTAETATSPFVFKAFNIDGVLQSTDQWVGKQPVVLNFWGTWCPPCRKEIPDLVRVYNEFAPKGVEMIGLAVRDQPDAVAKFSLENGMNWIMLMADAELATRFKLTGVPTTIFVDRNGNEIGRFVGPRDYETFQQAFDALLAL